MVNFIQSISKKYDKEIREKCSKLELEFLECLKNNFNDEFTCENYLNNFQICIKDFDKSFREKYPICKEIN